MDWGMWVRSRTVVSNLLPCLTSFRRKRFQADVGERTSRNFRGDAQRCRISEMTPKERMRETGKPIKAPCLRVSLAYCSPRPTSESRPQLIVLRYAFPAPGFYHPHPPHPLPLSRPEFSVHTSHTVSRILTLPIGRLQ